MTTVLVMDPSDWIVLIAVTVIVVCSILQSIEARRIRKNRIVKIEFHPADVENDPAAIAVEMAKQARADRRWP